MHKLSVIQTVIDELYSAACRNGQRQQIEKIKNEYIFYSLTWLIIVTSTQTEATASSAELIIIWFMCIAYWCYTLQDKTLQLDLSTISTYVSLNITILCTESHQVRRSDMEQKLPLILWDTVELVIFMRFFIFTNFANQYPGQQI